MHTNSVRLADGPPCPEHRCDIPQVYGIGEEIAPHGQQNRVADPLRSQTCLHGDMHGPDCATLRGLQHAPMYSQSATGEWVCLAVIFNANVRSRARAGIGQRDELMGCEERSVLR